MKKPSIKAHKGKGSRSEMLPHSSARTQLTGGDAYQRSLSNYAKETPSGLNVAAPSILGMGTGRFG